MNLDSAKLEKKELETYLLPFIPKNKRGFSSRYCPLELLELIVYKLQTGCQWSLLRFHYKCFTIQISWQTVYYFYRKWSKAGVFKKAFQCLLALKHFQLELSILNLDGTQTLSKKGGEAVGYQHRKKGKSSNLLVLTDGLGVPLGFTEPVSGNHNDLFEINAELGYLLKELQLLGIPLKNSILNADKGFDSKSFRRFLQRRAILPNIKENMRNRSKTKRGVKRFFNPQIYKKRYVNERLFAWMDAWRSLTIRYDTSINSWINAHYCAAFFILLKV